jgi:hypothetical protein
MKEFLLDMFKFLCAAHCFIAFYELMQAHYGAFILFAAVAGQCVWGYRSLMNTLDYNPACYTSTAPRENG